MTTANFHGIGNTLSLSINVDNIETDVALHLFDALARRLMSVELMTKHTAAFNEIYAEAHKVIAAERGKRHA